MKIYITSDSTSDLSPEIRERFNIKTIPLFVSLGEKNFVDGVDIVPEDIYDYYNKTGKLPKTASTNIGEFAEFFRSIWDEDTAIIHFAVSSEMSSSFNNAKIAAQEFSNIYVIDSRNLSTGIGLLMISAANMANDGMKPEEIVEKLNDIIPRVDSSFVLDNLEYLHKGGRCSAVAMLGANLLKLKPCIEVKNGKMDVGKKYRGKFGDVLKTYAKERLLDAGDIEQDFIFVTHAGCNMDDVMAVVDEVKKIAPFKEVFLTRAASTISSHCGQYTLGVLFIRKNPVA